MLHADPLEVHPLRQDDTTSVLFVRFLAGWARRAPVSCAAAEEFVVLDGVLELNGSLLGPGSVAHVPADAVRAITISAGGCSAVAWFLGPPRWDDADPVSDAVPPLAWHPWDDPGSRDWSTPVASWSRLLGHDSTAGRDPTDLVDLDERAWMPLPADAGLRDRPGQRLLRRTPTAG